MNKDNKVPWLFFLMAPIAFLIITFKDWLSANQLMFPAVITLFVAVFGILLVYGLKEWKKSDEEVLSAYDIFKSYQSKAGTDIKKTVLRALLGTSILLFFLLSERPTMPTPAIILVSILALLVSLIPILSIIRAKFQKSSRTYRITAVEVTAFLVGLIPTLFFCFFIGVGFYYGVWWFVAPPGLVFLVVFTRPLVAAVRNVYKHCRHDDEAHVRKGKEIDPWDRPDNDPEKYRRK